MKARTLVVLFWLASALAALAQVPPAPASFRTPLAAIELKDGDTLVFLGDSITHQCLYTQYVEDYFYTRYPDRRIRFHNAGVGGDRAADALARFDEDVAAFKPKYVTILLGMNDGSYTNFSPEIFSTYERDMTRLLDKIAAIGAQAIPMTPTMYDARAASLREQKRWRYPYYNAVLAFYGTWLREVALDRGLGFVNMWTPLNDITLRERKRDPKFTLIADAVHPDAPGQVVMAAALISDMVPRSVVSSILVSQQPKTGKYTITAANGKAGDLQTEGDRISFTFKANALPWVLPPESAEGYKLTAAGHRYSNEKITVRNLKPGRYELRIDGQLVGTYTDGQLAFGVELENNDKTPQYQQALKVALLNKERNEKAIKPLRGLWSQLKAKRRTQKPEELQQWLPEFKAGVAEKLALAKQYEDQIYQANQPVARKYEITRLP